ncbi:hypothetical protein MK079_03190 [Candidatus Gracilibacteria bacterium]|nr:hypothetical protein [Candidatus Gracilibacteria bacterium]
MNIEKGGLHKDRVFRIEDMNTLDDMLQAFLANVTLFGSSQQEPLRGAFYQMAHVLDFDRFFKSIDTNKFLQEYLFESCKVNDFFWLYSDNDECDIHEHRSIVYDEHNKVFSCKNHTGDTLFSFRQADIQGNGKFIQALRQKLKEEFTNIKKIYIQDQIVQSRDKVEDILGLPSITADERKQFLQLTQKEFQEKYLGDTSDRASSTYKAYKKLYCLFGNDTESSLENILTNMSQSDIQSTPEVGKKGEEYIMMLLRHYVVDGLLKDNSERQNNIPIAEIAFEEYSNTTRIQNQLKGKNIYDLQTLYDFMLTGSFSKKSDQIAILILKDHGFNTRPFEKSEIEKLLRFTDGNSKNNSTNSSAQKAIKQSRIYTIDQLYHAMEQGLLDDIDGMGDKTKNIVKQTVINHMNNACEVTE